MSNVVVVGDGASGGILAYMFAAAGNDTTLVGPPRGEDLDTSRITGMVSAGGLTLVNGWLQGVRDDIPADGMAKDEFLAKFEDTGPIHGRVERLLDGVDDTSGKASQADLLAQEINALSTTVPVVFLNNGLQPWFIAEPDFGGPENKLDSIGNAYDLMEKIGADRVIGGFTKHPVGPSDPGDVALKPPITKLAKAGIGVGAATTTETTTGIETVREICENAGVGCQVGEIPELMIDKIISIAALGLQAGLALNFKEATDDDIAKAIYREAMHEGHKTAAALGIELGDVEAYIARQEEVMAGKNAKGSLWEDIIAGNKTENNALHLAMAELADKQGESAPVLDKIGELVELLERQGIQDKELNRYGLSVLQGKVRAAIEASTTGDDFVKGFLATDFKSMELEQGESRGKSPEAARG